MSTTEEPVCKRARTQFAYKMWPSGLVRAGHTTVTVHDAAEPLHAFLASVKPDPRYGIHMARMAKPPCFLCSSSKFRHGAERWWCPVHQGVYGMKKQVKEFEKTGQRRCDHADDPIDLVRVADIPVLTLVPPEQVADGDGNYCELGVWIGLPPGYDTCSDTKFFPGIHVHARKAPGGPKVVDTNFPAVTVRDRTGRFPMLAGEGVTVTSPAALEYLYYMENKCPVNQSLGGVGVVPLPRSEVELVGCVRCKHCSSLHEDIGDIFGETVHKKHLCGQCGRDIFGPSCNIGNPLLAFRRDFKREVVGQRIDPEKAVLHLKSADGLKLMMWPSTPAIFWSREAPEVWGLHVHAYNSKGERVIDDTCGEVFIDGEKLERAEIFEGMLRAAAWLSDPDPDAIEAAQELEDD